MTDLLLLAFIFLVAGVVAVPLATRLGLGSVLGYLIAGMAISPLLGLFNVDVVAIQHFAEFGVVMMLFLVGLELEPRRLWRMRSRLLGLGGLQVVLTTAAFTGLALSFGLPMSTAIAIGLVVVNSSTAMVLQTLNEKGLMNSDGGQSSFSVLLFQDIAVIPILALLPLLALPELMEAAGMTAGHGPEAGHGAAMSLVDGLSGWQATLVTVGAIAAVIAAGQRLTGPIFRFIAMARLRELFTATALMIVVGIALLMSLVGLSPALGTFIAGVVLADSEYRHELESNIDPFKGLLLGLFFITVGAGINFPLLFSMFGPIVGGALLMVAVKWGILYMLGGFFGVRGADRWLLALGLAQAGEFGFVLLSFSVSNAVLPPALADQLSLTVALSILITPILFILYDRLIAPRYAERQSATPDERIDPRGSVIIAGHGRFGGIVNRMLRNAGFETTVLDYSSSQLEMLRTFGFKVYYGDATRPDLLHAAGVETAKVLVVAIDGKEQITTLVKYAVRTWPHLHVVARAVDRIHVYDLYAAGCRDIIRETYDSSIRAGRSAIEAMGIPKDEALQMAERFDRQDREAMIEVAPLHDPDIPPTLNEPYVAKVRELMEDWESQLRGRMDR